MRPSPTKASSSCPSRWSRDTMWPPADTIVHDDVELRFIMTGAGWANLDFRIGDQNLHIDGFSYLENTFHDVALAAISAASSGGHGFHRFALNGEPTEWRWTVASFRQGDGDYSHILVEVFPRENNMTVDNEGRYVSSSNPVPGDVVFSAFCSSESFAQAVRAAYRPLEESGLEAFEESWGLYPFPVRTLAALDAALTTPPRRTDPKSHAGSDRVLAMKRRP